MLNLPYQCGYSVRCITHPLALCETGIHLPDGLHTQRGWMCSYIHEWAEFDLTNTAFECNRGPAALLTDTATSMQYCCRGVFEVTCISVKDNGLVR
jgi:hypothetical protein